MVKPKQCHIHHSEFQGVFTLLFTWTSVCLGKVILLDSFDRIINRFNTVIGKYLIEKPWKISALIKTEEVRKVIWHEQEIAGFHCWIIQCFWMNHLNKHFSDSLIVYLMLPEWTDVFGLIVWVNNSMTQWNCILLYYIVGEKMRQKTYEIFINDLMDIFYPMRPRERIYPRPKWHTIH